MPCPGVMSTGQDCIVAAEPKVAEDCVICLSALDHDVVETPCGHRFHEQCMNNYLLITRQQQTCSRMVKTAKCPMCRQPLRQPFLVEASSNSGLCIMVTAVPHVGGECHFDRVYTFTSLGDFSRPGMLYVMTSNDDRKTPASQVMWVLEARVPVIVHLNFRSDCHVSRTGAASWLSAKGFSKNPSMRSTVSTGVPNGPYSGPVYSRRCNPGRVELMGSNTWEGVYFVFVELVDVENSSLSVMQQMPQPQTALQRHVQPSISRDLPALLQAQGGRLHDLQPQPETLPFPEPPASPRSPLPMEEPDDPAETGAADAREGATAGNRFAGQVAEQEEEEEATTTGCGSVARHLVTSSRRRLGEVATRFRSSSRRRPPRPTQEVMQAQRSSGSASSARRR